MGTSTNGLGRVGRQGTEILYRVLQYRAVTGRDFQDMEPCADGAGLTDACRDLDITLSGRSTTFIVDAGQEIRDDDGNVTKDIDHADTQKNSYALVVTRRTPLPVGFTNVPNSHDGSTPFTVRVAFEEDLDSDSETRLASAISVTNGSVSTAPTGVGGSKNLYTVGITPSSAAPVRISLRGSRNCTSTHSLCGETGRHMGSGPSVSVSVATDAKLESLVLSSPLLEPGTEQLGWSQAFDSATYSYEVDSPVTRQLLVTATTNTPGAKITLSGEGEIAETSEFTGTVKSEWTVPDAGGTLTVTVTSANGNVTQTYTVEVTRNPANLYVKAAGAYEQPGAELQFSVELRPARLHKVTVDYATSDGTAKAGLDYEAKDGKLTFEPGETLKQVTVKVHDDSDDEDPEWMRVTLSNASGALARSAAFGLITNSELTATFENLPQTHDGTTPFTFRIAFNQETTITAEAMRDHALTVGGGTVTAAAQVEDTAQAGDTPNLQNVWELTVQPSGSGDVSLLLPGERACTEPGAVCASDDRPLSASVSGSVTGPDGTSNTAPTGLPAISGTAAVGETLSASESGIADTDGLENASFTWQWIANDGTDTDIADATGTTYTLTSAEGGAFGELILAALAVADELEERRLHHRHAGGELLQVDEPEVGAGAGWQKVGGRPASAVVAIAPGDAAQIDGIKQQRPDVAVGATAFGGDLLRDLALTAPGTSPNHHRLPGFYKDFEGGGELAGAQRVVGGDGVGVGHRRAPGKWIWRPDTPVPSAFDRSPLSTWLVKALKLRLGGLPRAGVVTALWRPGVVSIGRAVRLPACVRSPSKLTRCGHCR